MFNFFKSEPLKIKIEELPSFLTSKFEREKTDAESKLQPKVQNAYAALLAIKTLTTNLSTKSSNNEYADRIKKKFCEKVAESMNSLSQPRQTFEDTRNDLSNYYEIMHVIESINMKEFRHLQAFKDDMTKIAVQIKIVENNINHANKVVSESVMTKVLEVQRNIEKILSLRQNTEEIRKEQEILNQKLDETNTNLHQLETMLDSVSQKLAEYAEKRAATKDIEIKIKGIDYKIESEFSGLDRPLKKFLYFGEMTKHEAEKVKEYIQSPSAAFLSDEKNIIRLLLEAMHNYKDKKVIDLEWGKEEKVKDLLRNMEFLLELRNHYFFLLKQKEEKEAEFEKSLQPILSETRSINADIDARKREGNEIKKRLASIIVEQQMTEKEIKNLTTKTTLLAATILDRDVSLI
ncbi:MAG: hypothetical protein NT120_02690 [Candidatus Aenigmarchaeota archaeon]|nr:hypothetical protein [Candidatus Aenigmarchaeota archaeon]